MGAGVVILEGRVIKNYVWNGATWVPQTNAGSGGTSSDFGDPFPGAGTAAGFKDAAGDMAPVELEPDGSLPVTVVAGGGSPTPAATNTETNLVLSNVNQTALSANAARLAFSLYNDSDMAVYVKFGVTASTTSFIKKMLPQEQWGTANLGTNYVGRIDVISETGVSGSLRINELEP